MSLISINPATTEEIKIYPEHSLDEIDNILSKTINAQKKWSLLELDFPLDLMTFLIIDKSDGFIATA